MWDGFRGFSAELGGIRDFVPTIYHLIIVSLIVNTVVDLNL